MRSPRDATGSDLTGQKTTLIDVHSHMYPDSYISLMSARDDVPRVVTMDGQRRLIIFPGEHGPPLPRGCGDVDQKLAFMASRGIDKSIVSMGNPWLQWVGDAARAEDHAHTLNEWFGRLEGSTAGRLVGMAVLPESNPDHTAAYIRQHLTRRGFPAVILGSNLCGLELDDPRLEPAYTALEEADLPIFIHPQHSLGIDRLRDYGPSLHIALGFPSETGLGVARLILGGVLDRHPRLRVVAAHGGGTIPVLAGRLVAAAGTYLPREDPDGALLRALRGVHVDSIVYSAGVLQLVLDTFGGERVMFGTDHPFYVANHPAVSGVLDAVPASFVPDVRYANAERLFLRPDR